MLSQEAAGRVTIASIYSIGLYYVNQFVKRHQDESPGTMVHVDYQTPAGVYAMVESDQADFGLVSYPKKSRSISMIPWWDEPMLLACSPHHPLSRLPSIELGNLSGQRMIGFSTDLQIRRELDRVLNSARVQVEMEMEFDNIETLKRAIEIHSGSSILPEPTVRREVESGALVGVPIVGARLERPVGIIRRRGRVLGTAAQHFLELLLRETPPQGNRLTPPTELLAVAADP